MPIAIKSDIIFLSSENNTEELANQIAKLPQSCMRSDRQSIRSQHGKSINKAMRNEWAISKKEITNGIKGALRFKKGKGRGGSKDY